MVNKFSTNAVNNVLNKVLQKYDLKPKHIMSTSGEFLVMMLQHGKQKFLIKIRLNNQAVAQKKFTNEIELIKFLEKKSIKGLVTAKIFSSNIANQPEYLLYKYINGYPLNGFYINIGQRATKNFLATNFFQVLKKLQRVKIPNKLFLEKKFFKSNFTTFNKNKVYFHKYASQNLFQTVTNLLRQQKNFLNNTSLVLTHGDINPKNLILTDRKLALIDWSEAHLNNPLYDLSCLYLFAWNRPEIKQDIKSNIANGFPEIDNPYHLFLLNRLLLIPRNIRIMENSITGLKLDRKNKHILPNTEIKFKKIARQAIAYYVEEAERISEYLSLWQKPNSTVRSIETLSTFKSANHFINKYKKIFGLKKAWHLKEIINHRLVVRTGDQKLITEYLFSNGKKTTSIMGKIRWERGDDLARQSYQIIKTIWLSPNGHKLISQPLGYFPQQKLYIYEKTLGRSLADLITNKNYQTKKNLTPLIKKSAQTMSILHKLPTKNFSNIKFTNNYNISEQLNWFSNNIKKNKRFNNKKNITLLKNLLTLQAKVSRFRKNKYKFIHGDFQLQNLILYRNKLKLIDFDNAEINDPLIDVGNFLNQINYKNILYKNSIYLRRQFLATYLKLNNIKLDRDIITSLNFYIIMGIIKNINLNFLEKKFELVVYDLKKISYLYKNITNDPVENLRLVKKILTQKHD